MESFVDKFSGPAELIDDRSKYSLQSGTLDEGRGSIEGSIDRFSGLPDEAANRVFKYLNVEDLSNLMQVSHKCYNLCMNASVLWISNWNHVTDLSSVKRYMNLVENFLSRRFKSPSKVDELYFTWNWKFLEEPKSTGKRKRGKSSKKQKGGEFKKSPKFPVKQYFYKIISGCGTESFILRFISPEGQLQELDPRFFGLLPNLKELTVRTNACSFRFNTWALATTSSNLEKLKLRYCKLTDEDICQVVGSLPSLKELCLHYCIGLLELRLQSKSLEHLRIVNKKMVSLEEIKLYCPLKTVFVEWYPDPDARPAFLICSDQLKEFEWRGFPWGYFYAKKSLHLLKASIHLLLPKKQISWDISRINPDLLDVVIDQLKTAKSITFNGDTIQLFHMEDCSLSPLSNVESLSIEYVLVYDKKLPAMAFFLQQFLDLKSLSIISRSPKQHVEGILANHPVDGYSMEFWETQDLKFVPRLNDATIEVNCPNGVELVKYLLKYGTTLERMKIVCFPGMESSILEQVAEYKSQSTEIGFSSI